MQKMIAVIMDENGCLSEIREAKKITVYLKNMEKWKKDKEIPLVGLFSGSMAETRKKLEDVIKDLEDCKIIVGKSVIGLFYNIFNQAGFIISELDDFRETVLDELYSDIQKEYEAAAEEKKSNEIPAAPVETDKKGYYFFDFSRLKNSSLPYSSKSTILPFLNKVLFKQLEIHCDHVMPWLEDEMKKRKLTYSISELDKGKINIIIKPM